MNTPFPLLVTLLFSSALIAGCLEESGEISLLIPTTQEATRAGNPTNTAGSESSDSETGDQAEEETEESLSPLERLITYLRDNPTSERRPLLELEGGFFETTFDVDQQDLTVSFYDDLTSDEPFHSTSASFEVDPDGNLRSDPEGLSLQVSLDETTSLEVRFTVGDELRDRLRLRSAFESNRNLLDPSSYSEITFDTSPDVPTGGGFTSSQTGSGDSSIPGTESYAEEHSTPLPAPTTGGLIGSRTGNGGDPSHL